jgi:uncharacterized protein YkwD
MKRVRIVLAALTVILCYRAEPRAADDKKEPEKLELTQAEKELLELTNQERAKEKLPPLKPNLVLFRVARAHSANMAKKGEMKHDLDGKNPAQRVRAAGYAYRELAENIAWGEGETLEGVMKGWMKSKIHRDNILHGSFAEIGIGIVRTEKGEMYYTQVFALPKKK